MEQRGTTAQGDGSSTQRSAPSLDPREILAVKLNNPQAALAFDQSISLFHPTRCSIYPWFNFLG